MRFGGGVAALRGGELHCDGQFGANVQCDGKEAGWWWVSCNGGESK